MTPRPKRSSVGAAREDDERPPRPIVPLETDVFGGTDVGRKRPGNEDSHGVWVLTDPDTGRRLGVLLVVADGMGGSQSGEVASQMAVAAVIRVVSQSNGEDVPAILRRAIEEANRDVHQASLQEPSRNGMGTTCTAVMIRDDAAWVAHVGDSRAYLLRAGHIRQLTSDHTFVAGLVENKQITRVQARRDPRRNILTRSIGPQPEVEADVFEADMRLCAGDAILLCSDGLHNYFNDSELADMITENEPSSVVDDLIAEANDRGGADNITVVIAHLTSPWNAAEGELPEAREA
jgi:serine/threonine protein phosphatase PrpC